MYANSSGGEAESVRVQDVGRCAAWCWPQAQRCARGRFASAAPYPRRALSRSRHVADGSRRVEPTLAALLPRHRAGDVCGGDAFRLSARALRRDGQSRALSRRGAGSPCSWSGAQRPRRADCAGAQPRDEAAGARDWRSLSRSHFADAGGGEAGADVSVDECAAALWAAVGGSVCVAGGGGGAADVVAGYFFSGGGAEGIAFGGCSWPWWQVAQVTLFLSASFMPLSHLSLMSFVI
jgi:hypothetical protein